MAKRTIDKKTIADEAYRLAVRTGLSSLGVREVALACGVSVGTIYNYFPSKTDIVAEVIAQFWQNSLADAACNPEPEEDFVAYVERVYDALRTAFAEFRSDWLPEIRALALGGEAVGHERERQVLDHMATGLALVLARDPGADPKRIEPVDAAELCRFALESMVDSLSRGIPDCRVLAGLLRAALYEGKAKAA